MDIDSLMYNAFDNCTVRGSDVFLSGDFTDEEMRIIHEKFTSDLLDYNIPHYRVVGVKYMIERDDRRVLRFNTRYGMTIAELGMQASKIIPGEIAGISREKGCFVGENESLQDIPEGFIGTYGEDSVRAFSRSVSSECFGQILHTTSLDPQPSDIRHMCGHNLVYCQFKAANTEKPIMLVPDFHICNVMDTAVSEVCRTVFFYMWGSGKRSYSENTRLFAPKSKIFPCSTVYDLSWVFTCRPLGKQIDRNVIHLLYKEDLNTMVLENILRNYGGGFGDK